MLRLRFYTKGDRSYPSSRYRAFQFQSALLAEGIDLQIKPLFGAAWMLGGTPGGGRFRRLALGSFYAAKRLFSLLQRATVDLIIIEQELVPLLPAGFERLLLGSSTPVLIELDDAHHLLPSRAAKLGAWFASAEAVIAGNEMLARAVRLAGGRPIVVPTCIDLQHYPEADLAQQAALQDGQPLRLIWVGLPSNITQLLEVRAALQPALESGRVNLTVVSDASADLQGLPAVLVPWSEAAERQEMSRAQVGLMPLPNSPWAAGKCALKLLQYQAAGLACIGSPVGMNGELSARGGVVLAEEVKDWSEAFERLRDSALRRSLAAAGRQLVKESYSVQAWAPKLARIYRNLAPRR